MPERNAGRKAGTEEGSGAPALRSKDRESPTAGEATQRAQTALVMAEKPKKRPSCGMGLYFRMLR